MPRGNTVLFRSSTQLFLLYALIGSEVAMPIVVFAQSVGIGIILQFSFKPPLYRDGWSWGGFWPCSLLSSLLWPASELPPSIGPVSRNPSLSKQLFGYAILGFALSEAMALFALLVAFLILFVLLEPTPAPFIA